MKNISISTCFDYAIPLEEQIPMIRDAGFTHVSIGGNYEHSGILHPSGQKALKALAADSGLSIDTIHGYAMDEPDMLDVNRKIAEAAAFLHVPVVVMHCSAFAIQPETLEARKQALLEILPQFERLAGESGVRFAFENVLPGVTTNLVEFTVQHADPQFFGFCYDSAHDQIDGPRSFDLLERMRERLIAVHLSDRIKELVDHVTPGEGFIEFEKITELLRGAAMGFPLLMEVMTTHSKYKSADGFLAVTFQKSTELYDGIYGK